MYFISENLLIAGLVEKNLMDHLLMRKKAITKVIGTESYQMDTRLMHKIAILLLMNMIIMNLIMTKRFVMMGPNADFFKD